MTPLSTRDLAACHAEPGAILIDLRPPDAYNGWRLNGEPRGGHIPGAKSLPLKWTQYIDWIEIVRAKGIRPTDSLILYGYTIEESRHAETFFARAGYNTIRFYDRFTEEWCADTTLPLERLPRYRHLIPPQWLHELCETGAAPDYDNSSYVICHAHYQNRSAYDAGHIPGAVELDTNSLESTETWNRRSPEELRRVLEQTGITADTTVILYGRFSSPDMRDPFPGSSAGHLGAIRCAAIMLYAGVRDVRILNGGLQSWQDAGYPVEVDTIQKQPVNDFGAVIPEHPEYFVDMAEAKAILADDNANLVSVRSWSEYIGNTSGYHYITKTGRIPGSVFGNCGSDAYHMENYRNLDHTMREYHEVARLWATAGITPDTQQSFYCGTGWRASEAFFHAWLMGWNRVSVFDGGWFEWSSDERNPIDTGIPDRPAMLEEGMVVR